jgi:hypothetical protein
MSVRTLERPAMRRPKSVRAHGDEVVADVGVAADASAEFDVLAALLDLIDRNPTTVREIAGTLEPAMLTLDWGPELLQAIVEAAGQESPGLGDVTVALRRIAADAAVDYEPIRQFVTDLATDRFSTGPAAERVAESAAERVRDAYIRRQQADRCLDLLHAINDTATTSSEITAAIERLASDASVASDCKAAPVAITDCLDLWKRNTTPPRVLTGFSPIDRNLGGGLPVGLTALAAKPKVGKSCLAGQLMLGALLHDPELTAIWFRGEMTNDQLLCKLLATWSELRHPVIEPITRRQAEGRDPKAAAAAVDMAMEVSGRLSIVPPPLTPARIVSQVRTIKPRLVVIDYLQKVQPDDGQAQRSDKRHEIEDTTSRIGVMALEHDVATIVISSLPKSAREEDGIGTLAKDSNLLDYDVNVFATIWKQQGDGSTLFRINANRDGPEADEQLWFDGNAQFFRPSAAQVHEEFASFTGGGE